MYRYSPGRCCCGGCDFVDDFDGLQAGYQITPHAGDPAFDVADGSLSLTGGDGSISRRVTFDAAQVEADGTGGLSAAAILGASSGLTGVFVGGVKGFAADWAGNRYVAFDCDPQGTPGDLETVGTLHPAPGDSIECRVAWSALTSSWRAQFYVNGAFQPFANVAVEFSGNSQRLGLVGEEGANWVFYRQDCSVTPTSATFCVDFYAGAISQILGPSFGAVIKKPWIDGGNAAGLPNATWATSGPRGGVDGTNVGMLSDWLLASDFGIVIPDGVDNIGCIPFVRYKSTNTVGGGSALGSLKFRAAMDGSMMATTEANYNISIFGSNTGFGPQDVSPSGGYQDNPAAIPIENLIFQTGYGFGVRYQNLSSAFLTNHVNYIDSMWLRVCYRINA